MSSILLLVIGIVMVFIAFTNRIESDDKWKIYTVLLLLQVTIHLKNISGLLRDLLEKMS